MYLNGPVKDVAAAREFYPKMGSGTNEQLSNDQNAVVSIVTSDLKMLLTT